MGSFLDTYNDPKRFAKFPNSIEKPIVVSTYKFSKLISIHFLKELVERS